MTIFEFGKPAVERLATASRNGMLAATDFVKLQTLLYDSHGNVLLTGGGSTGGFVGRETRRSGPQQDVHLRAGAVVGSYAMVESPDGPFLAQNCYWDGTNWQRYNIAQQALTLYLGGGSGGWSYGYAAAGANPIASFTTFTLGNANWTALLRLTLPAQARVWRSGAGQAIATGGNGAALQFDAVNYNTPGVAGGANPWVGGAPTRLTAPLSGYYRYSGGLRLAATAGGNFRACYVRHSNGTILGYAEFPASGTADFRGTVSGAYFLTAGDYLELYGQHDAGVNVTAAGLGGALQSDGFLEFQWMNA